MFSRFSTSILAFVLGASALASTGCAASVGNTSDTSGADVAPSATTREELDAQSSLFDTVSFLGQKAGPVVSVASTLYGFYVNVPGKLDAMNAKLDGIAGDVTTIKSQVAAIDTKMDQQYEAEIVAPIRSAENFIALDMTDLMATLQTTTSVDDDLWSSKSDALSNQYQAVDTASERILEYFAPSDAVASKWTATQWYRIYGYYLRASLAKLALRDAQATFTSTYWDRAPLQSELNMSSKDTYAGRKQIAVADLVATAQDVAKKIRPLRDFWITARDLPGLQKQQCFQNGTYRKLITSGLMASWVEFPYKSFRDPGAPYTSEQFETMAVNGTAGYPLTICESALGFYKQDTSAKVDAFVKASLDAPIASIEAISANWSGK